MSRATCNSRVASGDIAHLGLDIEPWLKANLMKSWQSPPCLGELYCGPVSGEIAKMITEVPCRRACGCFGRCLCLRCRLRQNYAECRAIALGAVARDRN